VYLENLIRDQRTVSMVQLKDFKDDEKWEEVCEKYGSIFHSLEWMNIIEDVFGVKKVLFGIFEGESLIGILPLFKWKKVFKFLMSPLHGSATPYGGPVLIEGKYKSSIYSDIIKELDSFMESEDIDFLQIQFRPEISYDEFELQSRLKYDFSYTSKYHLEDRYTVILDIDDKKELWNSLDKSCRNAIRKAEKFGVIISEENSEEFFNEYYRMAKDVYAKYSQPPEIPLTMYLRVYEKLKPRQKIRIMSARYNEKIVAGAIFLLHRDNIYYWDGVSYRNFNLVAPNNLIQWKLIEWASAHNYRVYDMLGAGIPKIGRFKLSFGGKIIPRLQLRKYNSFIVKASAKFYEKTFPVYRKWRYKIARAIDLNAQFPEVFQSYINRY